MADAKGKEVTCVDLIHRSVITSFNIIKKGSQDLFEQHFSNTENPEFKDAIESFINDTETLSLFISSAGSKLEASHELPHFKKKLIYFLKDKSVTDSLVPEEFDKEVFFGELTESHLSSLQLVSQEVYFPLLSNPANRGGWSGPTAKEVMLKFSTFLSSVSMTAGQSQGKTVLPPPPPEAFDEDNLPERERMHLLDTTVILWTDKIQEVLATSPETCTLPGQYPDPMVEVDFWDAKAKDLESLAAQLKTPKMQNVINVMVELKGSMVGTLQELIGKVDTAQAEASENHRFLSVLMREFAVLKDEGELQDVEDTFYPVFHNLVLIWKHSKTYNTKERLLCLVQEICNALITQAARYISGENIFRQIEDENVVEAIQMLQQAQRMCHRFKEVFSRYKVVADRDLPEGAWDVPQEDLFVRLNLFIERCDDILEFTHIVSEFHKLEKICLGGTKGKQLTDMILSVFNDFVAAVEKFKMLGYDIMDITHPQFDDDFYRYRCQVKDLERRLSSILTMGFDDCATIYAHFKLLESFEGLLQRPIIKDELDKKRSRLLQVYAEDLAQVQSIFHKNKENPRVESNLPPVAGRLMWCRGLLDRDVDPYEKLMTYTSSTDRQEAKEIKKMHFAVTAQLQAYETEQVEAWTKGVDAISDEKLKMPLLRRDPNRHLIVNFDDALVRMLREVKYFLLMDVEVIPSALAIFENAEQYRQQISSLELIVSMYNDMLDNLLDVERPLINADIVHIDELVAQGVDSLNWISPNVNTFIDTVMEAVKAVFDTVTVMKKNFKEIKKLMDDYSKVPLVDRKSKPVSTKDFDEALKKHQKDRFTEIKNIDTTTKKLLLETLDVLKAKPVSPTWRAYQEHVQDAIKDGLAETIVNSIKFLCEQMDPNNIKNKSLQPLLNISMGLEQDEVRFQAEEPAALSDESKGPRKTRRDVWGIINDWVESFFEIGNIMNRMDGSHYVGDLKKAEEIVRCINQLKHFSEINYKDCQSYKNEYDQFKALWKEDRRTSFNKFLEAALKGDVKVEEDEDDYGDDEDESHTSDVEELDEKEEETQLPLDKFEERILYYKELERKIDDKENINTIGWLRINADRIKAALKQEVNNWIAVYTSHMYNDVTGKLNYLETLMNEVNEGLQHDVQPGQSDELKAVLSHIHKVISRNDIVRRGFKPLKDSVTMLKKYGKALDEYEAKLLGDVEIKWDGTVDQVYKMKEKVNVLQNDEVDKIQTQVEDFAAQLKAFRDEFKANAPFLFKVHVDDAYDRIYDYHLRLNQQEIEAAKLNELEQVFELTVSKHSQIKRCRNENRLLKYVWDMICLVKHQFEFWERTLWDKIDVDMLISATKAIQQQLQKMPPEVRGWNCFTGLKDEVKNLLTILPLVNALHSPFMKGRHWSKLKEVTKKSFIKDSTFCLKNLLDLHLHKHVDDVHFIVDLANKENKIDNSLKKIEEFWSTAALDFKQHKTHENVSLIATPDEILQNLEEHMAALQSMQGQGAYVAFFIDRVMLWLKNLGTSETVVTTWLDVQARWGGLEAIFLGSADIREQLPEDTARFGRIDQEFKELMVSGVATPNVVEACCVEGREKSLAMMVKDLEKCERSLNQYLETKRRKFPRFYFLANAALLDILSNGYNPHNVQKHLGDCFDNIKNLTYSDPAEGEDFSRTATHMNSKDGDEHVPLSKPFEAKGMAEDWLGPLVLAMRETLMDLLSIAQFSAGQWDIEHPREKWLYKYPAQVCLTASQIVWTDEVNGTFDAFADGNEQAMKDYYKVMLSRLEALIWLVLDLTLTHEVRQKIITLITIDVHNRDVVQKLIDGKVTELNAFGWQSQLRYSWDGAKKATQVLVADAKFNYSYEYIGNTGRLVITPLTDRCYITLTQALNLIMGGAPAGPAGTGKTETVKDLGRAMGLPVYVFNCSGQMNTRSLASIYKGLAMTGAWGCFDEFNRIPIEVLSVVATQVASILNGIKADAKEFDFMGEAISLVPTVGMFITMNPGYAGRTELPENLKSLFRSCAMVVPDMELICENMLMSEGFLQASRLAKKFITLYGLSKELLSKQMHYDWGLRATKAVLRVAGGMKRADMKSLGAGKTQQEDPILLRALRDFNTPKLVTDDLPIFGRLVQDLFPEFKEVKRKYDQVLWNKIAETAPKEPKCLQDTPDFIRKCVELYELLGIRHSVFIIGPAGTGKTEVWQTLKDSYTDLYGKVYHEVLNPKAVRNSELYGWLSKTDWNDGILSNMLRNMSRNKPPYNENMKHKWVILDGDIDPDWIESLNTVMDDNKVLTLVSNERIPITAPMRLIFEVADLKEATPATVSRAGILYINPRDIGSKPFMDSWIEKRPDKKEKSNLLANSHKYCEQKTLQNIIKKFHTVAPVSEMMMIKTLCFLLEGFLDKFAQFKKKNPDRVQDESKTFESIFVWCCIWAYGGACPLKHKGEQIRKEFSQEWKSDNTAVKFPMEPKDSMVFDFYLDFETGTFKHWTEQLEPFNSSFDPGYLKSQFVPTMDSVRLEFLMDLLVEKRRPVLVVGTAGTGKTVLVKKYVKSRRETYNSATINLNFFTDAKALQAIMEGSITKRVGSTFGPPGAKPLIYFIDDLNMPQVDIYGTQSPSAFVIHHLTYGAWFDTTTLLSKKVVDCQYMAAMNPTAGAFVIHPRYQGKWNTFACTLPGRDVQEHIYGQLLASHFSSFPATLKELTPALTKATLDLHATVLQSFIPSTLKFHYIWNLRELSNVFQGLCNVSTRSRFNVVKLVRLWRHECLRVFSDRLRTEEDIDMFASYVEKRVKSEFKAAAEEALAPNAALYKKKEEEAKAEGKKFERPPPMPELFASFMSSGTPSYQPVKNQKSLRNVLEKCLSSYNESGAAVMDLELFDQACAHVVRIVRIIEQPNGNALLVGVGGSGKQSLARLASSIAGCDVFQISVSSTYGLADLKLDLQELYRKAGVKNLPITFLLTDAQIVDDRWLVYINDILSSGYIAGLFPEEDMDGIVDALRNEAKAQDIDVNDRDTMEEFFLDKVRTNLHLVLCFSPVGDLFRKRCQKFPALISCTSIDWFHPWPYQALVSVAERFMADTDLGETENILHLIADHMAMVHTSVDVISKKFFEQERRYNYTTPKSFLELIAYYKKTLAEKREEIEKKSERLEKGIAKLQTTKDDVEELKENLTETLVKVSEKSEKTAALISKMGVQRTVVEEQQALAKIEADKAKVIADKANGIRENAEAKLALAKPILDQAKAAVAGLKNDALGEYKTYKQPPGQTIWVARATMILLGVRTKNNDSDWGAFKGLVKSVNEFKNRLENFDVTVVDRKVIDKLDPITAMDFFDKDVFMKQSSAAANLAGWAIASNKYYHVFQEVAPLQAMAAEAKEEFDAAAAKLQIVEDKVAGLQAKMASVYDALHLATEEKTAVEQKAKDCKDRLKLAKRLVEGLAGEHARWGVTVESFNETKRMMVGDVMVASCFVSYIGAFNMKFRNELWKDTWIPDLQKKGVSFSEGLDPLKTLASDSDFAKWKNEGLAADRVSLENGALVTQCTRWPLMIDPQLQGIKWIQSRVEGLKVIQLNQKGWVKVVIQALGNGDTVLIENAPEEIDATLDPVLSRAIVKRGYEKIIKMGSEEIGYDEKFKLIIQTKLTNPHYKPEVAAQCTLVNFIVTEEGLEDQLLALVVNKEKPELEAKRSALVRAINDYLVTLIGLENELLERLSNAPDDILSDEALIDGLERTKNASIQIEEKVKQARASEITINAARNEFRAVAAEGSWLFFLIIQFNVISHMYQFSLDAFNSFFKKAMAKAERADNVPQRVLKLRESIRLVVFTWVNRGLFEKHKPILQGQLCFMLMRKNALPKVEFNFKTYNYLIRGLKALPNEDEKKPDFLQMPQWLALLKLAEFEGFEKLVTDIQSSPNRFKEWYNKGRPEVAALPLEWRKLDDQNPFMKLCIIRAMRNDRMTSAMSDYVSKTLPNGKAYTESDAGKSFYDVLNMSMEDATPVTPVFFILSPGTDPVLELERVAKRDGYYEQKFHRVALGEGQDVIAMAKLQLAHTDGHWVVLENIHLMPRWCADLEKQLDDFAVAGSHPDFRVFLSAEPSTGIPIGILERSIKLTNEPPQGLKQNLKRAFATIDKDSFDFGESKLKSITFVLCHFHAVIIERIKFGPKGWNRAYPFNQGDLMNSATVLSNYLESAGDKIPWADLRYIVGEILYGGHITDDLDRLLCKTYLEFYLREELFDEMELYPFAEAHPDETFRSPPALQFDQYFEYIDSQLPPENPIAFGLHPNTEIAVKTEESEYLFKSILELQPRTSSGGGGTSVMDAVRQQVTLIMDEVKDMAFKIEDLKTSIEGDPDPYQNVFLQEAERVNILSAEIIRALIELEQGLNGELQMSQEMEDLQNSLYLGRVPPSWARLAYPSLRPLSSWINNLSERQQQIKGWTEGVDQIPKVVNLALFFNPQSFLTAVMQRYSQDTKSPLDKLTIQTNPTRKTVEQTDSAARFGGAYVCGLFLEGAKWNWTGMLLEESTPREMFFQMPVIGCNAVLVERLEKNGVYMCPVFKTQQRGPTFVFEATLRTKLPSSKWVLAGVVMVLEADT